MGFNVAYAAAMSNDDLTAVERAFQLAYEGNVKNSADILKALKVEGYPANRIIGPDLLKQLRDIIKRAVTKQG